MLTRSRKRAQVTLSEAPVKRPIEKLTLLSLPELPLLHVLSYLSATDLCAAGRASPRLAAMTRTHASLWRRKETGALYFEDTERLLSLLRVTPPVYRLKFVVRRSPMVKAQFESFVRISTPKAFTTLVLEGPDTTCLARIIQNVRLHLEYLEVSGVERGLEPLLRSLPTALSLRMIDVRFESYFSKSYYRWPQVAVLPRLRTIALKSEGTYFDGARHRGVDSTVLDSLRSLLKAHSRKLIYVKLDSYQLLPLLDACSSALQRLAVTIAQGSASVVVQHMDGLKELRIHLLNNDEEQMSALLVSCAGQLERLDLRNCRDQTVSVLGVLGLTRLQYLVLTCTWGHERWSMASLQQALVGLPELHSLHLLGLRSPRPTDTLSCLSSAAIPKLSLLIFTDSFLGPDDSDDSEFDSDSEAEADSVHEYSGFRACQNLVRRAPMPLHVVARVTWYQRGNTFKCIVFFRHSAAVSAVTSCPLCTEVGTALVMRFGISAKFEERVLIQVL